MKIISLRAENVKRLKAVEITPDGNTVVISGRNGQGKSSVLDSIWMALAGASGSKETTRPIRDGEEKATVEVDLGDLIVTRRWAPAGSTLEVAARDGARYSSPQTLLDGLIGKLAFDPLAFAEQDAKRQLETLLGVVELPFDPVALADQRRGVFDRRTDINRETKALSAQLAAAAAVPDGTPEEEVSVAALMLELHNAQDANRARTAAEEKADSARRHLTALQEQLADLTKMVELAGETVKREEAALADAPATVDTTPLEEKIAASDATNAAVRALHARRKLEADVAESKKTADELTAELDRIDQVKADGIAAAAMPLEGLSFDEDGVLYQGVPFSQASSAERLRVSIAVAMALNPKIRVIRITDGSLLDTENLQLIEQMAAEHDFQIWIERVDETGKVGVVIEDGQVVKPAVKRAQAAAA